jgi:hypothetical protein
MSLRSEFAELNQSTSVVLAAVCENSLVVAQAKRTNPRLRYFFINLIQ